MNRNFLVALALLGLSGGAAAGQVVMDGGFETGTPNAFWDEFSTNFPSPICNTQRCGSFFGGPFEGDWWAWFGGATQAEVGWLEQIVTIPLGTATLRFQLDITAASGNGVDGMLVRIDAQTVFAVRETAMNSYHPYTEVSIDISQFADGGDHVLRFESSTSGPMRTNFFVDAVEILTSPAVPGDMNCDGALNGADIDPFFLALGDPAAYLLAFPNCDPLNGDINGDGTLNGGDIDPFFRCLGAGGCP